MSVENFSYTENSIQFIWVQIKCWLLRRLTQNSTSLFLRGKDIISVLPQVSGDHELVITRLIESFAESGYDNFLVDIGANIGLISCQSGRKFKEIHMFEPNPICCRVLEANSLISLHNKEFKIHEFGLGEKDDCVNLTVPRNNWGGAYIHDQNNCYDLDILFRKDGFIDFDDGNYFELQIPIKSAKNKLSELFSALLERNLKSGVIKIDVEGYELVILKGIADALPKDMKIQIIFESLDPDFKVDKVLEEFICRCVTVYTLSEGFPWNKYRMKLPNVVKAIFIIFKFTIKTVLKRLKEGEYCKGTLVIQVD